MITLVTKDTATRYNYLYTQAEKMLKDNGVMTEYKIRDGVQTDEENHISSLEEFFSYIEEISRLEPRYTILPIDEDVFEIDLNTRAISVPASFAKNGISVQGDEIAEIVYFRCNRFFDATDLAERDIYIQWESAAKDDEGNVIKGVSVPWVIDLVSGYPNHIIFGWPLSTKITKAPGTVKFSVRFYEWDRDLQQITYSLSTLTQTATIKPSLDYDLKQIQLDGSLIDNVNDLILDRFENSHIVNAPDSLAADPEILGYFVRKGNNVEFYQLSEDPAAENSFLRQCLGEVEEDGLTFKKAPIELAIAAMSDDAGRLTYEWRRQGLAPAGSEEELPNVLIPSEFKYIETLDDHAIEGKLYFKKISSNPDVFEPYPEAFEQSDEYNENAGEEIKIYERVNAAQVTTIGKYSCKILNRVNNATGKAFSLICLVPAPEAPIINENGDLPIREHLDTDTLQVALHVDAEAPDEGTLTYEWYRIAPGSSEAIQIIADPEDVEHRADREEYVVIGQNAVIDGVAVGDGTYFVKITNNLNMEDAENMAKNTIFSRRCRVTHAASNPIVELDARTTDENVSFSTASVTGIDIIAEIDAAANESRTDEDQLLYQWYKYDTTGLSQEKIASDKNDCAQGIYEVKASDSMLSGATEPHYVPLVPGSYICLVTNIYNESEAIVSSKMIDVLG